MRQERLLYTLGHACSGLKAEIPTLIESLQQKMLSLRALFALASVLLFSLVLVQTANAADPPRVLAIEFSNDVNPVTEDYLTGEIDRANEEGFDAAVILLDTPGGLDSSMRNMIKTMLDSEVPVIVYVSPPGPAPLRPASSWSWPRTSPRWRRSRTSDPPRPSRPAAKTSPAISSARS